MSTEPIEPDRTPQSRVLSFKQKFQISEWLRNNTEAIMSDRPSVSSLCRQVSEAMGFKVSWHPLKEILEAVGIQWEPRTVTGRKLSGKLKPLIDSLTQEVGRLAGRVNELEKALDHRQSELQTLRGLVTHLYHELGVKSPAGATLAPPSYHNTPIINAVGSRK
jgi:hypothetical protein